MANRIEIGTTVKLSRKKHAFTQQQLSERCGINKTTISEIENGRFSGSFDIFERVLDALDLKFKVDQKKHSLPTWNEIDTLFSENES